MRQHLEQLVRLQRIDERLAVLHRRLQSLPEELGERQSRHAVREAARDALEADRKAALSRAKDLENDVRSRETRIAKLEEQVSGARDAGAIQVAQHEVAELRSRISAAEDEALKLLEEAEELALRHAESVTKVEAGAAELEEFRRTVEADQADLEEEIRGAGAERQAVAASIPRAALEIYDKLVPSRKGRPMAVLKGDSCGGCGMVVPPNDRVKVHAMNSLARCKSCARILVLPEIWVPERAGAPGAAGAEAGE